MTFYTGDNMPEWKNNLFIAGLNSNHIARLVIRNNKVTGEERILADQKQRFRDEKPAPAHFYVHSYRFPVWHWRYLKKDYLQPVFPQW